MKYFSILAKHGHMGNGKYAPIRFGIEAQNLIEAIDKVKVMPGVKHDSPSLILGAKEITFAEYCNLRNKSAYERGKIYYEARHRK